MFVSVEHKTIIPYQERLGGYNDLSSKEAGCADYTIPRTIRGLQPVGESERVQYHYTIPRTIRGLQRIIPANCFAIYYTIPRTIRGLQAIPHRTIQILNNFQFNAINIPKSHPWY